MIPKAIRSCRLGHAALWPIHVLGKGREGRQPMMACSGMAQSAYWWWGGLVTCPWGQHQDWRPVGKSRGLNAVIQNKIINRTDGEQSAILSTSSSISCTHNFIFSSFRSAAPITSCSRLSCLNVRWNVTPHNLIEHFTKQLAWIMLSFHRISEHGWLSISCCIGPLSRGSPTSIKSASKMKEEQFSWVSMLVTNDWLIDLISSSTK